MQNQVEREKVRDFYYINPLTASSNIAIDFSANKALGQQVQKKKKSVSIIHTRPEGFTPFSPGG